MLGLCLLAGGIWYVGNAVHQSITGRATKEKQQQGRYVESPFGRVEILGLYHDSGRGPKKHRYVVRLLAVPGHPDLDGKMVTFPEEQVASWESGTKWVRPTKKQKTRPFP